MVFPSPKYSLAGLEYLLNELHCTTILTTPEYPQVVSMYLKTHDISVLNVPPVEDLLHTEYPQFLCGKTFSTACKQPLVVLHTSGSTSHPKPVIWTHDYAASFIQQHQLTPPTTYDSVDKFYQGNRLLPLLSPFHVSLTQCGQSVYSSHTQN